MCDLLLHLLMQLFIVHLCLSPIKMVSGDVAGVVSDGPDTQLDIDYQMDKSEVTVTFTGYESERDGVAHYQWAIGTAPRLDDVMPYSYVNLIEEDGGADGMLGKMTQTLLCIK